MCSLLKAIQFGYLIKQKVNSDKFMDTCSNFAYILSSRLKLQILKYMALWKVSLYQHDEFWIIEFFLI